MTRWPLSEAKAPECPLFSCVLSHKTMFFFYFAFTAESLADALISIVMTAQNRYNERIRST